MVHPYFTRISYRIKKKRRKGCPTSWEIDILYSLVRKRKFDLILYIDPIPNNYCQCCDWKKKKNSMMMHFLKGLFAKTLLTLCTVVYKRLRKCRSCHNVSGNVKSCVTHQTCCCSLKWPKLNLYSSSYVFDINQVN